MVCVARLCRSGLLAAMLVLGACADRLSDASLPDNPDVQETVRLAREGDPIAQTVMGNLYETNVFGAPDYRRAAAWYMEAARQDDALARYFLGNLYERGLGVDRDYATAAALYKSAADGGNTSAAFKLGYFHEKGLGVAQDFAAARRWYDVAEQGWTGQRVQPLQPEYLVVAPAAGPAEPETITLVPVASLASLPVTFQPADSATPADVATAGTTVADVAPSPAAAPGFYLHLASQRDQNEALAAWQDAHDRFPDLLDGLTVALAKLDLGAGAGVYYQVLAGPIAAEEDADIICARLQPQDQYCDPIPLTDLP